MPTTTVELLDALRQFHLLEPKRLEELARKTDGKNIAPRSLAQMLIEQGWLTPYQVNQLLQGRGAQLMLGSYVLLERLGEGGMGEVFKARNWKLGKLVAIKVMRKERLANETAVKRFHREARAAAQLSHPNVVHAYDADQVGATHIFVMEYVEGIDLAKLVQQKGPLPVQRATECIRQAALGLQHAHEKGMVHRDIKPHNLLLTGKPTQAGSLGVGSVKILDMGLARLANDDATTITQEGSVMGTLDYLAPEQARDSHTVDIRGDLYSLGCTYHFLLTGQVPFPGGTAAEKMYKHQFDDPKPVTQLRQEVPAGVAAVVRKLMAKKPEDRFQTPAELAAVLAAGAPPTAIQAQPAVGRGARRVPSAVPLEAPATIDDETIASPDTARPSPRRAKGRFRVGLLLAALIGVVGVGLTVVLLWVFKGPLSTDISKLTPGSLEGRNGGFREELVRLGGGNKQSEDAVARGLKWIARQQQADGSWPSTAADAKFATDQVGPTALGLLPLLGVGLDYQGGGYQKHIERGVTYLIGQQKDDGGFGVDSLYAHGLATIALCEAYGLKKEERTRQAAQKAVTYTVKAQHSGGGWRYKPGQEGDTSVTGWQFMALQTARRVGLDVPPDTFNKVSRFLDSVALPDGTYKYLPTDKDSSPQGASTAIGILGRLHLGLEPARPEITRGVAFLRLSPPSPKLENCYNYYYATQAMYHVGGDDWNAWNPMMRDLLIGTQEPDGSWSATGDTFGKQGGRLMVTSLSLLILEVYYRHVPFSIGRMKPSVAAKEKEVDLLRLIDPKTDSLQGTWRFEGGALLSGTGQFDRMQIRYEPPEEYTLILVVERLEGKEAIAIGLCHGGTQFEVVLDGWVGAVSGLELLDGKLANDRANETAFREAVFRNREPKTLSCTVRKVGVVVTADGRKIIDWKGEYHRLAKNPDWWLPNKRSLSLRVTSSFRITKIVLTPLP